MIGIGFDHFFILYSVLLVFLLVVFWTRQIFREKVYEWNISQEFLTRCNKCNITFLAHRNDSAARCPACGEIIKIRLKRSSKRMRY